MCRHLAYLGPPVTLGELILHPPAGLYRQSWQPRHQRYGTVNADGFGVGWYADGDPVPARYRRAVPIWADPSLTDLGRVIRSGAVLAAVRSATEGTAAGEASAAPYAAGRWLFSHNGALPGWPATLADLAATLPPEELLELEARCDSALVWALILNRLRAGASPGECLASTVLSIGTGRLNLLLTDGTTITATTWGDTLYHRHGPGNGVTVASEPYDDDPAWQPVPDRSLVTATPSEVRVTPLESVGRPATPVPAAAAAADRAAAVCDRGPVSDGVPVCDRVSVPDAVPPPGAAPARNPVFGPARGFTTPATPASERTSRS